VTTRLLTYTSLYPSESRPQHGIFIETRLRLLMQNEGIAAQVIAPVPWFPFKNKYFGARAKMAATPAMALRNGLAVNYPRVPVIPKLGMHLAPQLMARFTRELVNRKVAEFTPHLLDAHYFYPDGVAAAQLSKENGLPLVISARGSDINLIGNFPGPRKAMLAAAKQARALIAVSSSLREAMIALGMPSEKIYVLRNGIDGVKFAPIDRVETRARLGVMPHEKLVAVVGNLVIEKGADLAMATIAAMPNTHAVFAGEGPLKNTLMARAGALGCIKHMHFVGSIEQDQLPALYSAADALLLASRREGWPNVVLEAMACGTPVVAADVGAVREMIMRDGVGRVVERRTQTDMMLALQDVLNANLNREAIRDHALSYDWKSVTFAQAEVYAEVAGL
jgi:teichuronic acid biosynthesis glycosyltransferase TuaC